MKNGAWRSSRHLICSLLGALVSLPASVRADTAEEFVSYYQQAYVQGRDLVPALPVPLDTSSIATRLDLQSVTPKAALSGNAFLAADGTIIKLAGVQGCLSTESLDYAGIISTCAMISLAAMTATIAEIQEVAGNALPCHELGRSLGHPTVRYAECFFMDRDTARSLSEVLISKGVAFAFRDSAGHPAFPEYAQMENVARANKAGIWASAHFFHPYGERYRANPTMH
ncbi:nuclease [Rhizobium nepotum]|uniref:Nuclease n=1 Tax=Rhizobium nepotum 39/7 TaxID=1368418 RepID=A0ABR5CKV2_9HYPH|nr:nuclease [Rhizobium nepotum]KJF65468.1 nuclease [Rhizobium nepotum 39/7]